MLEKRHLSAALFCFVIFQLVHCSESRALQPVFLVGYLVWRAFGGGSLLGFLRDWKITKHIWLSRFDLGHRERIRICVERRTLARYRRVAIDAREVTRSQRLGFLLEIYLTLPGRFEFVGCVPKIGHGLTDGARDLRELTRPEKDQGDDSDEDQLRSSDRFENE